MVANPLLQGAEPVVSRPQVRACPSFSLCTGLTSSKICKGCITAAVVYLSDSHCNLQPAMVNEETFSEHPNIAMNPP